MNRTVRALGALLIGTGLALTTMAPATALPPSGAGPDTPGTSASVSPRTVTAGSAIRFTVSGFPAGETVYVKIDDGASCSKDAAQGACVYHTQKLNSKGSASGSFVLPGDLKPGKHWLRFLASKELYDADGEFQGVEGYTRRGGTDFTIVAGSAGGSSSGGTGSGSSAGGNSSSSGTSVPSAVPGQTTGTGQAAVTGQGGVVTIQPVEVESTPAEPEPTQPSAAPVELDGDDTAAAIKPLAATADESSDFPIVGTVGLVLLLAASAAVVVLGLRRPSGRSPGA